MYKEDYKTSHTATNACQNTPVPDDDNDNVR